MSGRSGILGFGVLLLLAGAATVWLFAGGDQRGWSRSAPDAAEETEERSPAPATDPAAAATDREGTAALSGLVRRKGKPAPARIEIRSRPEPDYDFDYIEAVIAEGEPVATGVAGEDGRFHLDRLPVGLFEVRAIGEAGIVASTEARIRSPRQTLELEIDLPAGAHRIAGLASWADGRPFDGVVQLGDSVVRTGSGGAFSISGVSPGHHSLSFCVPGLARYEGPGHPVPGSEDLRIVVDADMEDTVGRILAAEDDSPIVGAEVLVDGESAQVIARTDAEGRFRARVGTTDRWILARAPGRATGDSWPMDGTNDIVIRLDRAGRVRGRVLAEEDGHPLPGIPVHLARIEYEWVSDRPAITTTTAADGSFTFPSAPCGEVVLFVRGGGRATSLLERAWSGEYNPHAVTVPAGGEVVVTLRAAAAARIEGVVLDGAGRPIAGEDVRGWAVFAEDELAVVQDLTVSDGSGRFVIPDVPPGSPWTVSAGRGLAICTVSPLIGRAGEAIPVEIRLPEGRWIDFLVLEEATGQPLPDAWISLYSESGEGSQVFGSTDEDGACRLGPLSDGEATVSVSHPECNGDWNARWGAKGPPDSVEVRLRRGAALEGDFLGPDGEPCTSGRVQAVLLEDSGGSGGWFYGDVGPDGTFRITGLPEGRYQLEAWGGDGLYIEGIEAETGQGRIRLVGASQEGDEGRSLEILVFDPEGRPVPAASLVVVTEGPDTWDNDWLDVQDGRAEVWYDEDATEIRIEVGNARSASGLPLRAGAAARTLTAGSVESVEIRLPPELRVSGRVVLEDGTPIPGVLVRAVAEPESDIGWDGHGTARTGSDGAFDLGGLWEGEYTLHALAGMEHDAGVGVRVRAGQTGVSISLKRGRKVRVTVVDARGDPVQGASLSLYWEVDHGDWSEDYCAEATTDQRGVAELLGFPAGAKGELSVDPPSSRRELLGVWLEEWSPGQEEVRLASGLMVEGIVLDEGGGPARGAWVWLKDSEGDWETAEIAVDGSFRAGPFPPGVMKVYAVDRENYDTDDRPHVNVMAGARDVRLTYSAGWNLDLTIVDAPANYDCEHAWVAQVGGGESRWYWVGYDKRLTIEHRPAEMRYDVYLGPIGELGYVFVRGIGRDTGPVRASVSGGHSFPIRFKGPEGVTVESVEIRGDGFRIDVPGQEDGMWLAAGVPPAPFTVAASVRRGEETRTQVFEDVSAEPLELKLE